MTTAAPAALARARKLHIAKNYEEAIGAYTEALEGAADADVLESRGWCLLKSGRSDEAIVDFTRARFHYGLAKAYLAAGRTNEAIRELEVDLARGAKASKYSKPLLDELTGGPPKAPSRKAAPRPTLAAAAPVPKRKKGEGYDAYVARLFEAAALGEHGKAIDAARVSGVTLTPTTQKTTLGGSRIGGLPDLLPSAKWPMHRGAPMLFVMQVRLEELPPLPGGAVLPKGGLLSFFVCEGLAHDEYLDSGTVLFTPARSCTRLASVEPPRGFVRTTNGKKTRRPFGERSLAPTVVRKLANPDGRELAKLPNEVRARYSAHVFEPALADGGRHQLLGVRDRSYPGDHPATMTLLLQCVTEPGIGMHWGDDDAIGFFVPRASCAKADFAKVRLTYGD